MKILVVEDDLCLREAIVDSLIMKGIDVLTAANGVEAGQLLAKESVDLVLSDINMPRKDGLALLADIRQQYSWLPVLLMTAYGDVSQAVQAIQMGAKDYLMKPFELQELDALLAPYLANPASQIQSQNTNQPIAFSAAAKQLFTMAERVAATDSTVLISGESGTGKEVLARFIHQSSHRNKQPFVAINCAAIPENMLEAMLFGYEKGAFTGAYNAMPGKFEQANGGTLLLDEITEMDAGLQAKLLRVLQERQVERLGGKKVIDLDVRIVATTNRELSEYVADGHFREDLYYRLSVFPLHWQPLRQRREDIVPLSLQLLANHAKKMKRPVPELSDSACQCLLAHSWPGNVRELDNTLQRALILQTGIQLTANDLILTPVPKKSGELPTPHFSMADSSHTDVSECMSAAVSDGQQSSYTDQASFGFSEINNAVTHNGFSNNPMVRDSGLYDTTTDASAGELGKDLKTREVELIVKALREENSKKQAACRLGISPRTLRYKIARLRDLGVDIDARVSAY